MKNTKQSRQEKLEKATNHNPYYEQTELFEAAKDADNYHALKSVFDQEGGQLLVKALIDDVVMGLNQLDNYSTMSRDELVSVIARISHARGLANALTNASSNLAAADELLEEALQ